jgi:hypothetical protein
MAPPRPITRFSAMAAIIEIIKIAFLILKKMRGNANAFFTLHPLSFTLPSTGQEKRKKKPIAPAPSMTNIGLILVN